MSFFVSPEKFFFPAVLERCAHANGEHNVEPKYLLLNLRMT